MNEELKENGNSNFPDEEQFGQFISQYRKLMLLYESAVQCVTVRLDTIGKEVTIREQRSPIRTVTSRIKEPHSIYEKLKKRGYPLTLESITEHLNDIAGVRVICEYLQDVYAIRDALISGGSIRLVQEKDYIKHPKPNGYRSLHMIVDVPVLLCEGEKYVRCEIQIRTTAMDSWAGLEHNLRYKKERAQDYNTNQKLKKCASILAESDSLMQKITDELGLFWNI